MIYVLRNINISKIRFIDSFMWIVIVVIYASRLRNLICKNKLKKYGVDRR